MRQINREENLSILEDIKNPGKEKRELLLYTAVLVFLLFITIFINNSILTNVYVSGSSMEPTITTGDVLFINMVKKPSYYDIIVVRAFKDSEPYIKRVIGLSGDTIWCENGVIKKSYHNKDGEVIVEIVDNSFTDTKTEDFSKIAVKENEVFFMGDNRHNGASEDSRSIGCRSVDDVIGVVTKWSLKQKAFFTKTSNFLKRVNISF